EVHGTLLEAPEEYHIVSEIAKPNFMSGINYELKQTFCNNQILAPCRAVGEINYIKIRIALLNLKMFCEDHSLNKLAMNKLGFND
ncbi:O-acetyl-ADP-ribose deacetylase, partial [Aphis craccivora]